MADNHDADVAEAARALFALSGVGKAAPLAPNPIILHNLSMVSLVNDFREPQTRRWCGACKAHFTMTESGHCIHAAAHRGHISYNPPASVLVRYEMPPNTPQDEIRRDFTHHATILEAMVHVRTVLATPSVQKIALVLLVYTKT